MLVSEVGVVGVVGVVSVVGVVGEVDKVLGQQGWVSRQEECRDVIY